jgi:hypothetical protein
VPKKGLEPPSFGNSFRLKKIATFIEYTRVASFAIHSIGSTDSFNSIESLIVWPPCLQILPGNGHQSDHVLSHGVFSDDAQTRLSARERISILRAFLCNVRLPPVEVVELPPGDLAVTGPLGKDCRLSARRDAEAQKYEGQN